MRFKIYNGGGYGLNGMSPAGGPLSAPLYLNHTAAEPLHAVTKEYVDTMLGKVDAASITGNIPPERMPAYAGTDVSSAGYGVFNINPTGVVPGTYNKVTVNSKGLVTYGELIDFNTLTNVEWTGITLNKHTTLEGYGITDALKVTGGTMTGALYITATPSADNHLVTKGYVDQAAAAKQSDGWTKIGDMFQSLSATTPANHLRTNGAVLVKTSYAALYAVIGDTFNDGGFGFMGQPWRQQYAFNTQQSADITGWTTGTSLPATVNGSQAIVTKNRVYLLGGIVNGSVSSAVHTAPILSDGTLGSWTTGTPLPATVGTSQAIVTKNRVYLLGTDVNGTVYTAPINADGTLGAWTTGTSLPGAVYQSQAIVTKNRIYSVGGTSSAVHTAPINADGTLGTWTTGAPLPGVVAASQAIVTKNRVYLLGGPNSSTVYTTPILSDGTLGTWTTGTSLPTKVHFSQAIVTRNRVYLLGGDGSSTVYTAPINADGTLGTWATGTPLPAVVSRSHAIVTKNRVHLLGGANAYPSSVVYTADFSGGTNDYLTLIAENTIDTSTQFKLPDTSASDPAGTYTYIRAL